MRLPLSIGDDDLAATADELVSVPEMFNYWVGGGRIDVGFLGAAQIDRHGQHQHDRHRRLRPTRRCACRAPAARRRSPPRSREVIVIVRQTRRSFVERLDFVTSIGHGAGAGSREELGFPGQGPTVVVTDLGVLRPNPDDRELDLVAVHPGVDVEDVKAATSWPLRVRDPLETTEPPSETELGMLREMRAARG